MYYAEDFQRIAPAVTAKFAFGSEARSLFVVNVDGTDTSWRALYYAFGLARRQGRAIVAVFAFRPVMAPFATSAYGVLFGDELGAQLSAAVGSLAAENQVTAEFVRVDQKAVQALIGVATERRAEAIVIGAGNSLSRKLMNPAVARCVSRSQCPVIVVP